MKQKNTEFRNSLINMYAKVIFKKGTMIIHSVSQKRAYTVWFQLYKIPEKENTFIVTEYRLMFACWGALGGAK